MPTGCARRWCAVGTVLVGVLAGAARAAAPEVLKIKVIDTATGKAVPGVSLRYTGYSGGSSTTETTSLGPGGTTALTWSEVDKYDLTFSFSIGKRSVQVKRTVKATDANAASLILRIRTERYKKPLIVTVLDAATGKPLPNARINLAFHDPGGAGSNVHGWAETTAAGKATFNWDGEGRYRIWCPQFRVGKPTGSYPSADLTDDNWKAGKFTWKIKLPKLSARVKVFVLSKGKKAPAPDGTVVALRTVKKGKSGTRSTERPAVCKDGKVAIYGLEAGSVNTFCILRRALVDKHVPIDVKPWTFKGKVLDLEVTLVPVGEYRAKMTVRVIDGKGAPVAGAGVDISGAAGGESSTNSAGVATWSRLSIGRYTVRVVKAGYPVVTRKGISLPGTAEVIIKLMKGYGMAVSVFREGSSPAAAGICVAMPLSQDAGQRRSLQIEKGRDRLEELGKAYYLVMAAASKGEGTLFEGDRGGSVVDAGRITHVGILLRKVHPVRIELTAAKGAKVPAKPLFTLVSPEVSDLLPDTGDKVMLVAAAYMVYLRLGPKRYVLLGKRTVTGAETIKFDLKGGNLDKINWVSNEEILGLLMPKDWRAMTRPATGSARPTGWPLAVTVLDATTGKPVPGARLAIDCPKRIGWRQPPLQNTDADGKARFQGAGPGTHTLYFSRLRGHDVFHVGLRRTVTEAEWKAGKLTWKMKVPKVSVRVKVFRKVADDKHPAPDGLNVALWRRGPVGEASSRRILASCKDGRAEFYGLKIGRTYQIIYAHWATSPTLTPYVAAGAEARKFQGKVVDMEATLIPHEKYRGRLQVTVVGKDGKAVEGAEVKLGRTARVKATTDAKGTVAWSDLRAGWYEVRVYKKDFVREVSTVYLPGGEANTVTLGGAGSG